METKMQRNYQLFMASDCCIFEFWAVAQIQAEAKRSQIQKG